MKCLSDSVFVEHLPPCENPSQLLVRCSVDEEKRFSALGECVCVCVCVFVQCKCTREKEKRDRERESRWGWLSCFFLLVLWKKSRESKCADVICRGVSGGWKGGWGVQVGGRGRDGRGSEWGEGGWEGGSGWKGLSTHCRGHTRTGSPGTCRSLGRGLGTRLTLLPPHTGCGYYTCKRKTWRKKGGGGREEVSDTKKMTVAIVRKTKGSGYKKKKHLRALKDGENGREGSNFTLD